VLSVRSGSARSLAATNAEVVGRGTVGLIEIENVPVSPMSNVPKLQTT
jgi:hypothetical protein